ncbi:SSU72 [Bugula neritina]|uniref:RNA polymerase II subunit A C-terminal domain phosphatase SSU72 n=1 Tax=Bugula neritina TaxID=10212 RepID=A0A7J7JER4_BUGNE|nr:SSU72 [Bugula neritina]
MLDRNRRIKQRPERFQSCPDHFDIVITCEERVYDQCIEELNNREASSDELGSQSHIINIEIHDNHEEATIGAFLICDLCSMLHSSDDLDNEIDEILQEFESRCQRPVLHTTLFY